MRRKQKAGELPPIRKNAKPRTPQSAFLGQRKCPRKRIEQIRSELGCAGTGAPSPEKRKRLKEELKKLQKRRIV